MSDNYTIPTQFNAKYFEIYEKDLEDPSYESIFNTAHNVIWAE